jgi:hypothetical protein
VRFGPLLDDVIEEARRDRVSLLVQPRDDELATTYLHHGAVRLKPQRAAPPRAARILTRVS